MWLWKRKAGQALVPYPAEIEIMDDYCPMFCRLMKKRFMVSFLVIW